MHNEYPGIVRLFKENESNLMRLACMGLHGLKSCICEEAIGNE